MLVGSRLEGPSSKEDGNRCGDLIGFLWRKENKITAVVTKKSILNTNEFKNIFVGALLTSLDKFSFPPPSSSLEIMSAPFSWIWISLPSLFTSSFSPFMTTLDRPLWIITAELFSHWTKNIKRRCSKSCHEIQFNSFTRKKLFFKVLLISILKRKISIEFLNGFSLFRLINVKWMQLKEQIFFESKICTIELVECTGNWIFYWLTSTSFERVHVDIFMEVFPTNFISTAFFGTPLKW